MTDDIRSDLAQPEAPKAEEFSDSDIQSNLDNLRQEYERLPDDQKVELPPDDYYEEKHSIIDQISSCLSGGE